MGKRWGLTIQRRTNRKSKNIYERLHIIQKYFRTLIYKVQDSKNFNLKNPDCWYSEKRYLRVRVRKGNKDNTMDVPDDPSERSISPE